jgi:hypothetical protein
MSLTGLAFVACFFLGCGLAFARHPIFGLVTYVAVFYLNPPTRWWGASLPDLRWSLLAAVVTALAILVQKKDKKAPDPPPQLNLFDHGFTVGFVAFVLWITIQSIWALDSTLHAELVGLQFKYLLLMALMYRSIESETHLRMFLWAHVLGCFYMGWLAFTSYEGGRFENFGGPGIGEANAGALQVVTGIFIASAMFLAGKWKEKAALFAVLPFIVNALVTTVSRSGFLAALVGGIMFNLFTPKGSRKRVLVLSSLAAVMFVILTGPAYWLRMNTIKAAGEEVDGEDTGGGRLALLEAQWKMFEAHPLGCGHRCTAVLSPDYLDERYLTTSGDTKARSSHNTPMTMLVEHGVPGGIFYLLFVGWVLRNVIRLRRVYVPADGYMSKVYAAIVAVLFAIIVGDFFVDYVKAESRIWFVMVLMIMARMAPEYRKAQSPSPSPAVAKPGRVLAG